VSSNSFLSSLSEDERMRLLMGAERTTWKSGDVLLQEGAAGSSLLVLEAGQVEVSRGGAKLAVLQEGATIGEMALLDPAPRSATVTAKGKVTTLELERQVVWGLLADGDPAAVKALQSITATVCERLADVNNKVQNEVVRPRGNVFSRLFSSVFGRKSS